MVFNSISFLVFFAIFFSIYYFILNEKTKWQNILLLVGSYFFYGYADWKMLPLLFVSTLIFYFLGIWIEKGSEKKASILTNIGVIFGVGILLYFKYLNFFIESFASLFESIGLHTNWHTFNIIMPIGISFFTFKLISYIVEIHRGKIEASRDFVDFATYISFFPCVLSGPIDRPNTFLPQLKKARPFDCVFAVDGCRQILWGLFKKVVVADTAAHYVDFCWNDIGRASALMLVIAMFAYLLQMYADFSGYSDMAIGVAKLLGFKVTKNFNNPLFSLNIADYWRKWHISLTAWLTDYIFMPLNIKFRNLGTAGIILAIIINMVVIGLWHGANWTFVLFGLYHGLLYIPLVLSGAFFKKSKCTINKQGIPTINCLLKMFLTMTLVSIGLVLFHANDVSQTIDYFARIVDGYNTFYVNDKIHIYRLIAFTIFMIGLEWLNRSQTHALFFDSKSHIFKFTIYFVLLLLMFVYGGHAEQFIYFQF